MVWLSEEFVVWCGGCEWIMESVLVWLCDFVIKLVNEGCGYGFVVGGYCIVEEWCDVCCIDLDMFKVI